MAVSFSTMNTRLANLVRDDAEEKYTSASGSKLTALNLAIKEIVFHILTLPEKMGRLRAVAMLRKLQVAETIVIPAGGYTLSSLGSTIHDFGFLSLFVYVGVIRLPAYFRDSVHNIYESNTYHVGSDNYPIVRIVGSTMKVEVDSLSYPLDGEIHYIREHKTGILSGNPTSTQTLNLELPDSFEGLVLKLAKEYLLDQSQDYEQSQIARNKYLDDFNRVNNLSTQNFGEYV